MRKLSTRVFSFVLALMLCVSVVCGSANKVSAAEVPSLSISPLVTSSVNSQAFQVQVSADATYGAYIDGALLDSGTLTAGSHTLSFNTSGDVFLDVYITYTDENGDEDYVSASAKSVNAYWVEVQCVADDGTVLKSESIKLSKYNEPQVVYNAPAVIDNGDVEYHAANPSVVFNYGDSGKTITYTTVAKGSKSVTVNYVDAANAVLYTESKTLNYGDSTTISAPSTYSANGNTYTLKTTASYDVTYENAQSVYTFEYVKQAPAAQTPYNITIKLVDENGSVLHTMTKSVDVGKQVTVSVPATYEVGLKKYALADDQAATIVHDYANSGTKTYTVSYKLSGEAAAYTVTINLLDQATGTVLGTVSGTVEPDGVPFTYDISSQNSITKGGVTYWVVSGQGNSKGKIVHAYNDGAKDYNLYYSAKKDSVAESYAVTMRYICVNDDKVLATETQTVKVNSSVTFKEAPATLKVQGKEYARLNGQTGTTVHKYNDAQTVYEIYYRDTSISEDKDDIIYVPGEGVPTQPTEPKPTEPKPTEPSQPTTPTRPTTPSQPTTPTQPTTPSQPTTPTQPTNPRPTTPTTPVVPDDDEAQVTTPGDADEEPTEAPEAEAEEETTAPEATVAPEAEVEEKAAAPSEEVEIIEEDEVPLAGTPANDASNGGPSAVPFVIGGVVLLAIILLILFGKKRKTT